MEGAFLFAVSRVRPLFAWAAVRRGIYHKDCEQSCAAGRCHWCVAEAGPVPLRILDGHNKHQHRGCAAHTNMIARRALNIGEMYDDAADTPAVLRAH